MSILLYLSVTTAIEQVGSLTVNIQKMLTPSSTGHLSPQVRGGVKLLHNISIGNIFLIYKNGE